MFATLFSQSPEGTITEVIPQSFINDNLEGLLTIPSEYLTDDWNDWLFYWHYSESSERQIAALYL